MGRYDFQGKTAVITGASSGIGKATLLEFAKLGMNLVVGSLATEQLAEVEAEFRQKGIQLLVISTDVSKKDEVRHLFESAVARFGGVDILVCSAGIYHHIPVEELELNDLQRVMSVNFFGAVHCIYEALPLMMKQREGRIVLISSVDGKKGLPLDAAYVASKFAIAGFADVLRQEMKKYAIHVSTIFPSRVDTPMISNMAVPAISPKVPPRTVAQAIIRAIRNRKAETYVPAFSSKLLIFFNFLSPRFADWLIQFTHLEGWEQNNLP